MSHPRFSFNSQSNTDARWPPRYGTSDFTPSGSQTSLSSTAYSRMPAPEENDPATNTKRMGPLHLLPREHSIPSTYTDDGSMEEVEAKLRNLDLNDVYTAGHAQTGYQSHGSLGDPIHSTYTDSPGLLGGPRYAAYSGARTSYTGPQSFQSTGRDGHIRVLSALCTDSSSDGTQAGYTSSEYEYDDTRPNAYGPLSSSPTMSIRSYSETGSRTMETNIVSPIPRRASSGFRFTTPSSPSTNLNAYQIPSDYRHAIDTFDETNRKYDTSIFADALTHNASTRNPRAGFTSDSDTFAGSRNNIYTGAGAYTMGTNTYTSPPGYNETNRHNRTAFTSPPAPLRLLSPEPIPLGPSQWVPRAPHVLSEGQGYKGPGWYKRRQPEMVHPTGASLRNPLPTFVPGPVPPLSTRSGVEGRPPAPFPMPASSTVFDLPSAFNRLLEGLEEHRPEQLAAVEQQREVMRYLRRLNERLDQDVRDRQEEMRSVLARVDQLRGDMWEMRARGFESPQVLNTSSRYKIVPPIPGIPISQPGNTNRHGPLPPSPDFVPQSFLPHPRSQQEARGPFIPDPVRTPWPHQQNILDNARGTTYPTEGYDHAVLTPYIPPLITPEPGFEPVIPGVIMNPGTPELGFRPVIPNYPAAAVATPQQVPVPTDEFEYNYPYPDELQARPPIIIQHESRGQPPIIIQHESQGQPPIIIQHESQAGPPIVIQHDLQARPPTIIQQPEFWESAPNTYSSANYDGSGGGVDASGFEPNAHSSASFGAGSTGMNVNGGTMNTIARDQRVEYGDQYVDSNIYHTNSPSIPTMALSGVAGASFASIADRLASTYSRLPGYEGYQQNPEIAFQPVLGVGGFHAIELYKHQIEMGSMMLSLLAVLLHWLRIPGR